ncbi:ABC transporter permease, partial [Lysinibacillus fusiformis]
LDQMNVFFLVLKIGLIFVGTIAVLIASIGIFNTMTMAVTERTREIGVLKAIGASPKLIQRLFLMESTFIGILGTLIAV